MGSDLFRVEKFSGKIFSFRYPIEKRPPPPKEKSVFEMFGRFFFGYMGIGEIIYGKIGGDFTCVNSGKGCCKNKAYPLKKF